MMHLLYSKITEPSGIAFWRSKGDTNLRLPNEMTYSEIGSFFWLNDSFTKKYAQFSEWLPEVSDSTFTFSGRASIELALCDIMSYREVKKVYAPAYCCISMLQPFINRGIKIQFYDITFGNNEFHYDINIDHGCDIVLIMNYFGIGTERTHEIIRRLHKDNTIVMEDITHSLLNSTIYSPYSDYLVGSLRKWFAIPTGGWLGKVNGRLAEKPSLSCDLIAVEDKIQGMKEKALYIAGRVINKEHFLQLNAVFEDVLDSVDGRLKLDPASYEIFCNTDVRRIRKQRRKNAAVLLQGLKDLNNNRIGFPDVNFEKDLPLFYPIFLEENERESLRRYLIGCDIYCPVHWPEIPGVYNDVNKRELSLICDQRYSENDMRAILKTIDIWLSQY